MQDAGVWAHWNNFFDMHLTIWGQYPVFSRPEFPPGLTLMAAGKQVFFPSWIPSGLTSSPSVVAAITGDCDIIVYWQSRKYSISQLIKRTNVKTQCNADTISKISVTSTVYLSSLISWKIIKNQTVTRMFSSGMSRLPPPHLTCTCLIFKWILIHFKQSFLLVYHKNNFILSNSSFMSAIQYFPCSLKFILWDSFLIILCCQFHLLYD